MASIEAGGEKTLGWTHFVYPEFKLLDSLCVAAGYGLAEVIYFRDRSPGPYWQPLSRFVVVALVVTMVVNHFLRLYGQSPRDAWADKVRRLALSGTIVLSALVVMYPLGRSLRFEHVPFSVVIAGCVLATSLMGLVRMSFRLIALLLEQGRS
jgi:FlaA1/EpsC-like NDP-sugar epimerase